MQDKEENVAQTLVCHSRPDWESRKKMMQDNEKIKESKELLNFLDSESKSINETLSSARDFHYNQLNENLKQFLGFNIKLGELSLIVGAAIGPVIIAASEEVSQPVYVFLAIILYLANGIFSIWKAKDSVEKQLDAYSPSILHKLESDIYPLVFAIDKLRFDPKNQEYIDEFSYQRAKYLEDNTEIEIPKKNINFTLDINVLIFVLASVFLIRTVWPFGTIIYWVFFTFIILFVFGLIVKSYIQAKERSVQNACNTKKLNELKRTHIEWQKRKFINNTE